MDVRRIATTTGVILGLVFLFLVLVNLLKISYPIEVTTKAASGELSVVSEGKVDVVPDAATVELGVVVNNATTVEGVRKQINDINNKIIDSLTNLKIDKKDVKTSNYSINPNYVYSGEESRISGYNGNVTISVKVKETEKLAQVVGAAISSGANNVFGTNYTVENPEKYREQAREKAIQNAREQAKKLANQLGIRLGRVVNVVESTPSDPQYFYDKVALSADGRGGTSAAPNLQPGSQTITSVVTLYFEKR